MAAGPSKWSAVAWVIKEWRFERLAGQVIDKAQQAAEAIRGDAERDARRIRRLAAREVADATEYLAVLERLAVDLQGTVRGHREAVRADAVPAEGAVKPERRPPRPADRRRRGGRASLRTRAVAELFQSTDVSSAPG
jgi:hypothetical protein